MMASRGMVRGSEGAISMLVVLSLTLPHSLTNRLPLMPLYTTMKSNCDIEGVRLI